MSKIFKWWESFFLGMARALDLGVTIRAKRYRKLKRQSLKDTWNEDWNRVNKDFAQVKERFEKYDK